LSHQKSSTVSENGRIYVVNTAGFKNTDGAFNATTSKKNRKRVKPKSFPDTDKGFIAAENESQRRSTETDDVRQRNSEGRKGAENFSRVPHHKKHLTKKEEKKRLEERRKRKEKRKEKSKS
jgi:hypothetical protein